MAIQSIKQAWFSLPQEQIRIIRFALAVGITFIIAVSVNWSMAVVTPILLVKTLEGAKAPIGVKNAILFVTILLLSFFPFIFLGHIAIVQPILSALVLFLCFFGIFYYSERGLLNPLISTFLLIGITLIPLMTLFDSSISIGFTLGFMFSAFLAIFASWVAFTLLPDSPQAEYQSKPNKSKEEQCVFICQVKALTSTLIIFPLALYFFASRSISDALMLVFVAILAQEINLINNLKKGAILIITNVLGGLLALLIFMILQSTPTLPFFTFLMIGVLLITAQVIASQSKLGLLLSAGLSTTLVLLGGVTEVSGADFTDKFFTRIVQIFLASSYIVIATIVLKGLFEERIKRISPVV